MLSLILMAIWFVVGTCRALRSSLRRLNELYGDFSLTDRHAFVAWFWSISEPEMDFGVFSEVEFLQIKNCVG
jgi:hypothetical protein